MLVLKRVMGKTLPRANRLRLTGLIRLNGELMAYGSKGRKAMGSTKRPNMAKKMEENKKRKGGGMTTPAKKGGKITTAKKMEILRGKRLA